MLFFYSICSPHSHLASLKKKAQEQQFSDYQLIKTNSPILVPRYHKKQSYFGYLCTN